MVLLRRVIGDALRARRQGQHRTLREVSTAANVSLGYLSEIERGQKEASSELLASICDALGAQLSDVLRQVSDHLAVAEEMDGVLVGVQGTDGADRTEERVEEPVSAEPAEDLQPTASLRLPYQGLRRPVGGDGEVTVSVRHDAPLRTTLRATRSLQTTERERDAVLVA
jgi:transcriptional regulator with XRE-family HTH domain